MLVLVADIADNEEISRRRMSNRQTIVVDQQNGKEKRFIERIRSLSGKEESGYEMNGEERVLSSAHTSCCSTGLDRSRICTSFLSYETSATIYTWKLEHCSSIVVALNPRIQIRAFKNQCFLRNQDLSFEFEHVCLDCLRIESPFDIKCLKCTILERCRQEFL